MRYHCGGDTTWNCLHVSMAGLFFMSPALRTSEAKPDKNESLWPIQVPCSIWTILPDGGLETYGRFLKVSLWNKTDLWLTAMKVTVLRRTENNNKCRNLERLKWRPFFFIPHSFGVEEAAVSLRHVQEVFFIKSLNNARLKMSPLLLYQMIVFHCWTFYMLNGVFECEENSYSYFCEFTIDTF